MTTMQTCKLGETLGLAPINLSSLSLYVNRPFIDVYGKFYCSRKMINTNMATARKFFVRSGNLYESL